MLMTLLSIPVGYSQQGILSIDAVQGGEGGHKEVYRYIENKNSILQWQRRDIGQGEGYNWQVHQNHINQVH